MRRMLAVSILSAVICAMTVNANSQTSRTLAQRLGYPADAKVLIVHADDMGMSHNVNAATLEAMTKGKVSSASIMVPCPWFPEAAEIARANPDLDLGIHLTLNAEWKHYKWRPISPAADVPGLIDEHGFMWGDVRQTVQNASAAQVEAELRAQVKRAIDFGINPTHVDSHMGTIFARPDYFAAYRKVAREFKVPYMVPRPTPELLESVDPAYRSLTTIILSGLEAMGDPALDYLVTDIEAPAEQRTEAYVKFVKNLKPGVTQLIIHCGGDTAELRAITNSWARRVADAAAWTSPAVRQALEEEKVHLIGWKAIKELRYPPQ